MNQYQLAGRLLTTGWKAGMDVNMKNEFGMTPAQVATQAGNVEEFKQITSHPDFNPSTMGPLSVFLEICKNDSFEVFAQFHSYFKSTFCSTFQFDAANAVWIRKVT